MKKIIVALMALAAVGLYSCEKDNQEQSGNTSTQTPGGEDPTPQDPQSLTMDSFVGVWNLMFVENATIHYNLVPDAAIQSVISPMENDIVLDGNQWNLDIQKVSESQVTVTGSVSIDLGFQGVPAIPLSFETTGTVTDDGLIIDQAEINQSIMAMNVIPIDLTGTVNFAQPTAKPDEGNLTVVISSISVNGVGEASFGTFSGGLTLSVSGSQMKSNGTLGEDQ